MKGKKLEDKFRKWCKESGIYIQRFFDAKSMGRPEAPTRPADFWIFIKPKLIFVECKHTNEKSLPFGNIRPSQYKAGMASKKYGYDYVFLVEINDEIYSIKFQDLMDYIKTTKRKSIPYKELVKIGVLTENKADLKRFLEEGI